MIKFIKTLFIVLLGFNSIYIFGQEGEVKLNQDPKLIELMKLKKEVNIETFTSGQYTIQIFNGKYDEGSELMDKLISEQKFKDVFFSFETPYYKIRIGKYVSKLEAIKKLKIVKKTFPSAFILKPN
ncbi:uncharacterized protein METZ01_LOCUS10091 [marine metagenome]|uniref:Uncharacterized protein n=1 Tax=marine metagenome TaxID=408172 RepID=A0A381NRS6_9ZZZZ